MCWQENFVQVTNSSNVSDPEIIYQDKIWKYENNDLFGSAVSIFKSVKPALWLEEGGDNETEVDPIDGISSKATYYLAALNQMGLSHNTPAQISDFDTALWPSDTFHSNWARSPGNTRFDLKAKITIELQNLYMSGKGG